MLFRSPELGGEAPQKTPGMILVDEVDMHLHPRWQQLILPSLQKAFPLLQWIVTTHSPQVLSTTHKKNIRLLLQQTDGTWSARDPLFQPYGESSTTALERVMEVDSWPLIEESAELARLTDGFNFPFYRNPA